jgi:TolB-like protein
MSVSKTKVLIRAAFALFLLVPAAGSPALGITGAMHEYRKVRVIVFDFDDPSRQTPVQFSRTIRTELAGNDNFAVLDIEEINRLTISGDVANKDIAHKRRFASYAGSKLRADKVVTGTVTGDEGSVFIDTEITDVVTGRVIFSKRYGSGIYTAEGKPVHIASDIGNFLLRMPDPSPANGFMDTHETRPEIGHRIFPFSIGPGLSAGMLISNGLPAGYLKNTVLAAVHADVRHSAVRWAYLDVSAGYARFSAKNIENGKASLLFVPVLAEARFPFRLSYNPWIPGTVLFAGGGATFLSLNKTQNGVNTSATGIDTTLSGGIGLSFVPKRNVTIDLEGRYMYLFEGVPVSFFYGGVRAGIAF